MRHSLGIDLGATTCVVAVRRGAGVVAARIGRAELGMPAVAWRGDDGLIEVGEDADAGCLYEPALVARYVTARLGDGEPLALDGHPVDPLDLTSALLAEAAERAAPRPGALPEQVAVTYPLLPGPGPEDLLAEAATRAFGAATLVPAPIAAVARVAAEQGLADDVMVAVVDVGGSSVDVTLVRRSPTTFDLVGDPVSLIDLGGVDFDGAVLSLVESAIGDVSSMVTPTDGAGMLALRRLRASCRAAKELLSTEDSVVVDVAVPHGRARVEITREGFERTIEPALVEIFDLVRATVDDVGLIPADLRAVILTGGSARIPRLVELARTTLGRPVLVEDQPEATAALGAALFADGTGLRAAPGGEAVGAAGDPWSPGLPPVPEIGPTAGEWSAGATAADDEWGPDARTSVFVTPPPPATPAGGTARPAAWGQTSDDEARRLTASAGDPFGRSSVLLSRQPGPHERDGGGARAGAPGRLLLGVGLLAAATAVVAGSYAARGSSAGDDPAVAVAESSWAGRPAPTSTTAPTTTSTTVPATSTTEAPDTGDAPGGPPPHGAAVPWADALRRALPPPAPPWIATPPPVPTTAPPASTSTTSTSTSTTTTTEPCRENPWTPYRECPRSAQQVAPTALPVRARAADATPG